MLVLVEVPLTRVLAHVKILENVPSLLHMRERERERVSVDPIPGRSYKKILIPVGVI